MGKTVGLRSDNHSCWVKYINVCHVADSLTAITMQLGTKWKIAKTHLWKGICQNTPTTSIFVFYTCSSTFGVLPPLRPLTTWRAACVASNMAWSLLVWLLASPYHLTWPSTPLFALYSHFVVPLEECIKRRVPDQIELSQRRWKSHYKPPYHARMDASRIPCGQQP